MKPLVISKAGPNIRFLWIENPRMRAYAGIRGGFALACTGRVVCYHVFPDMVVPHLTPSQIMDSVDAIWPLNMPKISMTADSYFTSLGWMESHPQRQVTFAISKSKLEPIIKLFSGDLLLHQYRVFQKGDILLSLWQDNSLVICATNTYHVTNNGDGAPPRI